MYLIHSSGSTSPSATRWLDALSSVSIHHRTQTREWLGFVPFYYLRTRPEQPTFGPLRIVATGSSSRVEVDPRDLFLSILRARPDGVVLVHNHPSGSLKASREDLQLTTSTHLGAFALGMEFPGQWIVGTRGEAWISAEGDVLEAALGDPGPSSFEH